MLDALSVMQAMSALRSRRIFPRWMRLSMAAALWIAGGSCTRGAGDVGPPQDGPPVTVVETGPLRLELHISRTAHLFHVVDQISAWSEFSHLQYLDGFGPLEADDQRMLALHRDVRSRHGWGAGLEQTLYTTLPVDEALDRAVIDGRLALADATAENRVLAHFAPRVDQLMAAEQSRLLEFREQVTARQARLAEECATIARWFGVPRLEVEAYVLANPSDHVFGGGFNGGRLTIEVPRKENALPMLLHELFHGFVRARQSRIQDTMDRAGDLADLDFQMLNEGLVFALSPGIFHDGLPDQDMLAEELRLLEREVSSSSSAFRPRALRFAVALRPALRDSLEQSDATVDDFLPRAFEIWREMAAANTTE